MGNARRPQPHRQPHACLEASAPPPSSFTAPAQVAVTVRSGPFLARSRHGGIMHRDAKLHCHRKLHEGLTGFVTWSMVGVFPHSTLARGALTLLRTSRPPFGIPSDFLEAAWMWPARKAVRRRHAARREYSRQDVSLYRRVRSAKRLPDLSNATDVRPRSPPHAPRGSDAAQRSVAFPTAFPFGEESRVAS